VTSSKPHPTSSKTSDFERAALKAQRAKIRKDPRFKEAMEFVRLYGGFGLTVVKASWDREVTRMYSRKGRSVG
jgi:hypothetical protein